MLFSIDPHFPLLERRKEHSEIANTWCVAVLIEKHHFIDNFLPTDSRSHMHSELVSSSTIPIADLSVEILREILRVSLHCRETGAPPLLERSSASAGTWRPGRLFSYSQVCRLWRMVLFSSPDLWSSIFISEEHHLLGRRILTGVKFWLDRSDPLPLDVAVHLDTLESDLESGADLVKSLIDILKDHARKFRRLSLRLPSREILHYSTVSLLSNTPLLEDLHLCLPSSESSWRKPQCFSLLLAPKLSALRCIGWKAFYMPETPLHNLLEIRFDHYIPHSLAWDIIANAPNLKVLQMGLENDGRLSHTSIITHHDLRKLDLRARDSLEDDLNPLLDRLSVPNLEELALSISSFATFSALVPGSAARLLKFLEASSSPHVARLSLHNIGLSSSDVREVFKVLSGVVTLDLSGASLNADIASLISTHPPQSDTRQCLPLLKSLIMDVKGRDETDVKALFDVIAGDARH